MKLEYWIADCIDDSEVYSIREKTRKAVNKVIADSWNQESFRKPRKVTIIYKDAFDLAKKLTQEGGAEGTLYV